MNEISLPKKENNLLINNQNEKSDIYLKTFTNLKLNLNK